MQIQPRMSCRRRGKPRLYRGCICPQHVFGYFRQPVDPTILIFGFQGGKKQFGEQIETAKVALGECARSF